VISSIYFENVYVRETTLPPLSLDVAVTAAEVYECPEADEQKSIEV
jgi:hypothetical protein